MNWNFTSYTYSDDSYAIGELGNNDWPNGFAYMYWAKTQVFAMGEFANGKYNGWVCSNFSNSLDVVNLSYYVDGTEDENMPSVYSKEDYILIGNNSAGKCKLIVWNDGGWRCQENKKTGKIRCVGYSAKDKKAYVGILSDQYGDLEKGKWINDDTVESDFVLQYQKFEVGTYPNPGGFSEHKNQVDSNNAGPTIGADADGNILIGNNDNGWCDVLYKRFDDQVMIAQKNGEKTHGPCVWVWTDGSAVNYSWHNKGHETDVRAVLSYKYNFCEIKNYTYTDENLYDCIYIDKDFNVRFYKEYDDDKEKAYESKTYYFEELMSEDNEPKEEPKKTRRVKTTPTRNSKRTTTTQTRTKTKYDSFEEQLLGFLTKSKKK